MSYHFKGIVHFEINFWYVLAYLKGIQDIGVFVSTVVALALCGGPHIPALYDWQTRTVWPKNIKIEITVETKTHTSWMPLV